MQASTQQNPTYFQESKKQDKEHFGRSRPEEFPVCSISSSIRKRIDSRENEDSDVFFDNESDIKAERCPLPKISGNRKWRNHNHSDGRSFSSSLLPRKGHGEVSIGLGKKISQLFWKPKSKSSVGSDNSSISELASPTFQLDSTLSIDTNSLDSDSHSSSHSTSTSTHSNSDPNTSNSFYMNTTMEDQFSTYSYDDCQRYSINMYYNVGEESSLSGGTLGLRPRNNSVPTSKSVNLKFNQVDDRTPELYYNTNFSTFPNPRRHSIAASSTSSFKLDDRKQNIRDGYLVPIPNQKLLTLENQNNVYMNEDIASGDLAQVDRCVYIPTLTSSETIDNEFNQNSGLNHCSTSNPNHCHELQQQSSNDSSSTMIDAAPIGFSQEKLSRDKTTPVYSKRIFPAGTDCEPYCSLCASSVKTPTSPYSNSKSYSPESYISNSI